MFYFFLLMHHIVADAWSFDVFNKEVARLYSGFQQALAAAVRVFDVIAASDPADPVTAEADAHRPPSYLDALAGDICGIRIGVPRWIVYTETADPESDGPAHITLVDPDGNPVLIDQHR